jgi:type IV pilus assembly protein PilC
MPVYVYEGRDFAGRRITGELEAIDVQAVFNLLKGRNIVPTARSIKKKGTGLNRELSIPGLRASVTGKDTVLFTRQFATMINAGLPIVQSLEILVRQSNKHPVKLALTEVKEAVETGGSLSDALRRQPRVFGDLYVNLIAAGEAGGTLDEMLTRIAYTLEKSLKLKREIKTAMIYPSMVVAVAGIVTSILLIFVIPSFKDLFEGSGASLPWLTQQVIDISNLFVSKWPLLLTLALATVLLFRYSLRTPKGQKIIHPLALNLPVFGDIIRKVSVARFSRTLGTMISAGVPILEALQVCAKTAGNCVVAEEVRRSRVSISEGQTLAGPLVASKVFPPMVVQMIAVGESTGALDKMLQKIAESYEDEVDNAVAAMKQLIEPTMIVVLGGLIGVLVVAMYLPIFQMGSVL